MKVKDHLVSKEVFELKYNKTLQLYQTQPVPQELSKYYESKAYLSHTNAQNSLFEKAYQCVKTYMLRKKRALVSDQLGNPQKNTPRLLDYGAGSGDFATHMLQNNWEVTAIEPHTKARALVQSKQVTCYASLQELPEHKKYDIISLWHVLEHIPNYIQVLEHLKTLLAPKGKLIIAVPNFKSYDATFYKQYWAGWDVPRHLWHFSEQTLKHIATKQGFDLETSNLLWFDAFYVSILSERYQKNKFATIKGGIIGLISNLKAFKTGEFSSKTYLLSSTDEIAFKN